MNVLACLVYRLLLFIDNFAYFYSSIYMYLTFQHYSYCLKMYPYRVVSFIVPSWLDF